MGVKFDEIGCWSEIKLDIIREYATSYSAIMSKQSFLKGYYYIDGFSGAGVHISKTTKEFVLGSPTNALNVVPPFTGYHFIDLNGDKIGLLREICAKIPNVNIHQGDCNEILIRKILPEVRYERYKRALCVLDPYGLHLNWEIIHMAGQSRAMEIFLNFPVMDMNMNVLWNNPERVDEDQIARMNAFWGDDSWRQIAYSKMPGLFDIIEEKRPNDCIAEAFRERLQRAAGFAYVPIPIPMRNTKGGTVYYLFFASPNRTGSRIVEHIFKKYKDR